MTLPDVLQPLACGNPDCSLPEGGRCARLAEFPEPLRACPDLHRESELPRKGEPNSGLDATEETLGTPNETSTHLAVLVAEDAAPWNGRALTIAESNDLLCRASGYTIAVLGSRDAGKTCLLTSFFLQLSQGQHSHFGFNYRFASSRSLYGWYDHAKRATKEAKKADSEIIGHTTISTDYAEFLHLGLRPTNRQDDRHIDVLFSDVPGEWVSDWTTDASPEAQRRLSFIRGSDAVLVIIDASSLVSGQGRREDSQNSKLVQRAIQALKGTTYSRSLGIVFTKLDTVVSKDWQPPALGDGCDSAAWEPLKVKRTLAAVRRAKQEGLRIQVFGTSAFPRADTQLQPIGVVEPFAWAMTGIDRWSYGPRVESSVAHASSSFNAQRRWRPVS